MTGFAVLLRGVNVGGHRRVPSADLRAVAQDAGFEDVTTLLASGNVVFSAPGASPEDSGRVARPIAAGLLSRLGLDVDVVGVSARRFDEVVAANPFPEEAATSPSHLLVTFWAVPPDEDRIRAFDTSAFPERLAWAAGVGYTYFPDGAGTSRLTPAVTRRALGVDGTARNWSTVLKLQALTAGRE